jgi:sugar phosphate isomerase/epimerase
MNEPIKKYMKVGIVHFMAYPATIKGDGPIIETIKKILVDDYFDAIEITTIAGDKQEQVKLMLETSHITVAYGAQPRLLISGLNINDINEDGRQKALANLKEGIDEAYKLGAGSFAFLSGKYEETTKEESFQALVKSTKEICTYAKGKGDMKVSLEVFDHDIDKKSLIGPANLALRYVKEIRKDFIDFGLMVDLSHIPLIRETIEEALLPVKNYISHAHMGNCVMKNPDLPCYGDGHPRFGFPDSENDVDELVDYLKLLLKIGYLNDKDRPILSFEIKPFGLEDPDIVIANAKRVLNFAWTKV